jgi:hypothetical protein
MSFISFRRKEKTPLARQRETHLDSEPLKRKRMDKLNRRRRVRGHLGDRVRRALIQIRTNHQDHKSKVGHCLLGRIHSEPVEIKSFTKVRGQFKKVKDGSS